MAWPAFLLVGGIGAVAKKVSNAAIVAAIISGITHMYKTKLGLFVVAAMLWMGINFATIKIAIEPAIHLLRQYSENGVGGGGVGDFGATAVAWLGVLQFDRAITMIISAVITKHAVMQGRLFLFKKGFGAP